MKSQVYQTQFLLALDPDEPRPLRDAQSEAMERSGVSLQTAKRLTRELAEHLDKERQGRSYIVTLKRSGVELLTRLLENPAPPPKTVITDRGVHLVNRIPRAEWSEIMRQVKDHDLSTAFVPRDAVVTVTLPSGEEYTLDSV